MRRTVTTAVLSGLVIALAACGGSDSDSSSDASARSTTSTTSGGGQSGGKSQVGFDLTIAAAGSFAGATITSDAAPSGCSLDAIKSASVDIMPGPQVEGMASGDYLSISSFITKIQINGVSGMDSGGGSDPFSAHAALSASGSTRTLTLTDLPVEVGGQATTLSGTVTCPKA
jgi:hypothetical protein